MTAIISVPIGQNRDKPDKAKRLCTLRKWGILFYGRSLHINKKKIGEESLVFR